MNELANRIGDILIAENLVTPEVLARAIELQRQSGGQLGEILIGLGAISAQKFYRTLARQLGVPFCDLMSASPDPEALKLFSPTDAKVFRGIPLSVKGDTLEIAIEEPTDLSRLEAIRAKTGLKVAPQLAMPEDIDNAIRRYYELPSNVRDVSEALDGTSGDGTIGENGAAQFEDAPIIHMVDNLLLEAARRGASDVHIEPFPDRTRVRFRMDGVLEHWGDFPRKFHDAIVTRIKVLGGMDIAEKRLPQDGRFSKTVENRRYDLRLSTLPTMFGEKAVIRLLEQSTELLTFDRIGLSDEVLKRFRAALSLPHGLIVVAGPTGSGKSTTVAAALNELNTPSKNIVTIEDPVEYIIPGVNHTQVNIKSGLGFATAIRHILRQDPDVIMVGEVRDSETAEMAFRAALTGHLVLTTIHANDALSILIRLEEMGVNRYMALSSTVALFSQRLVRTVCPWCKYKSPPPEELVKEVRQVAGVPEDYGTGEMTLTRPCAGCPDRAYKRRTAISEIILVNEEFRRRYIASADPRSDPFLNPAKRHDGMLADGARKVLDGITTWEEVLSVFSDEANRQ
ncbi:MAG TPA: Flp pilus assembly complex ATPase component TadA [Firmicutes bacterium]|nr:Flp pilus assembly complex ATPase component TadA [Bacillota bacterium]